MEEGFANSILVSRELVKNLANTLKTLDVRGWESIDALVGCVMILEKMANAKVEQDARQKPAPEINSVPPEGIIDESDRTKGAKR